MPATMNTDQIAAHNRNFGYAGDVSAVDAWQMLKQESDAVLVDVRTPQEWEQVGVPDLSSLHKELHRITWKMSPDGQGSQLFAEQFSRLPVQKDARILLLCRGGVRSQAAAIALTQAGYSCCMNVSGGFEGQDGWKASQLP